MTPLADGIYLDLQPVRDRLPAVADAHMVAKDDATAAQSLVHVREVTSHRGIYHGVGGESRFSL